MNILVIGASGRVGSALVEQLLEQNHKVTGTSRHPESPFNNANYTHLQLDLTAPQDQMAKQIRHDFDAVYFTSGSGGKNLLQVDLDGAVKIMNICETKGLKRFIMLSTVFSLDTNKWDKPEIQQLLDYYIAKHYADKGLINSSLNFTILQPGALKEREPTHKIEVNSGRPGDNAIQDVAATLAAILESENTVNRVIHMENGNTPIKEALASV